MGWFSGFISEFLMSLPPAEKRAGAMVVIQFLEILDVIEGGGTVGVDGTTVTLGDLYLFEKSVLPKLIEALGDEVAETLGIDKEVMHIIIQLIKVAIIFATKKTEKEIIIALLKELKEQLFEVGHMYEKAAKILDALAEWLTERIDQITKWFQSQKDTSSYQYFYVETSRLLATKAVLKQQEVILKEKASRVREIRKQVNFGVATQQQLYFCLTGAARKLESEASVLTHSYVNLSLS